MEKCYICGNKLNRKRVDIARYWGEELVVLHDVPTLLCKNCGNRYFEAKVSAKIDERIKQALRKRAAFESISVPVVQY
jgi:YgiT-type zinc finger domain-containing protein